jgi:hypothetical protein
VLVNERKTRVGQAGTGGARVAAPSQCPSMATSTHPSEPLVSRRFLSSVTLASGAGRIVDFALPLFAGAVLGAGHALVDTAGTLPVVLVVVLVSRAAGAFLWVALRATAGARHRADSRVFAPLMSAEELGSSVVLAPAIALLAADGYAPTFAAAAACAPVAGVLLASSGG